MCISDRYTFDFLAPSDFDLWFHAFSREWHDFILLYGTYKNHTQHFLRWAPRRIPSLGCHTQCCGKLRCASIYLLYVNLRSFGKTSGVE